MIMINFFRQNVLASLVSHFIIFCNMLKYIFNRMHSMQK